MQSAASEICPGCGRTLEETFGRGLGCVFCLLQIGIGGEGDGAHLAAGESILKSLEAEERFGVYKIERWEDEGGASSARFS